MTTRYVTVQRETARSQTAPHGTAPRRRRGRNRRHLGRNLLLLLLLLTAVWGGARMLGGVRAAADWSARGVNVADGTAAAISSLARRDSRAKAIVRHPEEYPPALLELLAANSETLDFVLAYPAHHDDAPAQSLDEPLDSVPLLLQWDARWGYQPYGESTVAISGCAPACLSMAASYLTGDAGITPYAVAQYAAQQGYYVPGQGTSWELLHTGAQAFGVAAEELPLDKAQIDAALDAGRPVICSMLPGDFTTSGHFIVLCGRTAEGYAVRDPNSRARSEKAWDYETLSGQIGNLWACRAA